VTRRWAAVFRALDALHPREPHWYLATLGVDPDAQGEGIGSALASSFLKWADRDASPAYLETDRPENVPFYERRGFRVEHVVEVLGAPIWRMLRPAASPKERDPASGLRDVVEGPAERDRRRGSGRSTPRGGERTS
jgi:hypothetical protein